VARLLSLLVQVSGAKRIFEMGSAIGYSTIWLARAAGPKGKIFYTDGDPEKVGRAQMYFRMAGVAKRIEVQIGDALAIVKKTPGMFDVIFIDVDKDQYPAALDAARPKLRRGGLLITDNTIWSGKAARPAPEEDKDTKGVQEFNRMVYASKELYPVLIPLRDGLTICRKS
jgi:caffeoyl-CoA O-methyltransferase